MYVMIKMIITMVIIIIIIIIIIIVIIIIVINDKHQLRYYNDSHYHYNINIITRIIIPVIMFIMNKMPTHKRERTILNIFLSKLVCWLFFCPLILNRRPCMVAYGYATMNDNR